MYKKRYRTWLTLLGVTLFLLCVSKDVNAENYGLKNPRVNKNGTIWDCIYFGNFYQSSDTTKEKIKWRVLSVNGNDAFLLSDQILDNRAMHEPHEEITWENCEMRAWLNTIFLNEAFSADEQNAIKLSYVINNDIGKKAGNNTYDKIYLLSAAEASNKKYGFDPDLGKDSYTRIAKATYYATLSDGLCETPLWNELPCRPEKAGEDYIWWLRTSSQDKIGEIDLDGFVDVFVNGESDEFGNGSCTYEGVRPVLHINLSSEVWSKAGTVKAKAGSPNEDAEKKKIKISSVKYKKGSKKITGKISVKKATVKIKVGNGKWKKATVKKKKFSLKVKKLKKNTKIKIKVMKDGYKTITKTYHVKS